METGSFGTTIGLDIFYRYWNASKNGETVILCIHGLAGDSRIFDYFSEKFSSLGYHVYAIDLPGFGMSAGEKGDVSFDDTIRSLHDVVATVRKKHTDAKIFMLGFSLGGLYALWYALIHHTDVNGIITLAPLLRMKGVKRNPRAEPSVKVFLASLIRYFITPSKKLNLAKSIPSGFGELAGSEWSYMMKDPICNFDYSYRYIFDVLVGKSEKIQVLYKIRIPVLMLHGSNDWTVVLEQSKTFLNMINSSDKELKIFDCDHWFYHTFFYKQDNKYSEASRTNVINAINEWVRKKELVTQETTK